MLRFAGSKKSKKKADTMAKITNISWCDGTLNFWEGCEKVSEGCKFCFAEERDIRFHAGEHWGKGKPRKLSKSAILNCRRFNKHAAEGLFMRCTSCGLHRWQEDECCGTVTGTPVRPIMFVMSLGDFGDEAIDPQWLADALIEILKSQSLDFMILTKRITTLRLTIQRATSVMTPAWRERVLDWMDGHNEPANVAVGCSIESAPYALARLEALAAFPAVRRFVSAEPLLSGGWAQMLKGYADRINLVIAGGESGNRARAMHPAWPSVLESACDLYGIPYHFKQWGTWTPTSIVPGDWTLPVTGNFLHVYPDGKVAAYDPIAGKHPGSVVMWRTGKAAGGHACDASGRTRTEILTFPSQPWKHDWQGLSGHPLGDRLFTSRRFLDEFLTANPSPVAIARPCAPPKLFAGDWL